MLGEDPSNIDYQLSDLEFAICKTALGQED